MTASVLDLETIFEVMPHCEPVRVGTLDYYPDNALIALRIAAFDRDHPDMPPRLGPDVPSWAGIEFYSEVFDYVHDL